MTAPGTRSPRLIVGITGASGTIFGVRLLEVLRDSDVETHLIVSKWGGRTLVHETSYPLDQVRRMATHSYLPGDQGAAVSSGSFLTAGWWSRLAACARSPPSRRARAST